MLPHNGPFLFGQLPGFEKNRVGHADLADVVKEDAVFDVFERFAVDSHRDGQRLRILHDAERMSIRLHVPTFKGRSERPQGLAIGLLEFTDRGVEIAGALIDRPFDELIVDTFVQHLPAPLERADDRGDHLLRRLIGGQAVEGACPHHLQPHGQFGPIDDGNDLDGIVDGLGVRHQVRSVQAKALGRRGIGRKVHEQHSTGLLPEHGHRRLRI